MTRVETVAEADAYVGLGSNLDHPVEQVRRAFEALDRLALTRLVARSPLYRSDPVGPPGQSDYINAVAHLRTGLGPLELLDALQLIESRQGRVRGERWGPRTLDLDLLLFGDEVIDTPRLTVPHPRLVERAFVLLPLKDVAAEMIVPGLDSVSALAQQVGSAGVSRLAEAPDD
jgi:2-amino-4-hydroxy-6-hydroxymethyldihydropteridine diphosphokinase